MIMDCIENKTIDEIKVGDTASITRTLTQQSIQLFAFVTGDMNPAHLDEAYAKTNVFHQIVGHGMWTGSMFSALLGMHLPGPGTIYLSQTLSFRAPVRLNETVTASVTVKTLDKAKGHVTFDTRCVNAEGKTVLEGEAVVFAPKEKICWPAMKLPEVTLSESTRNYEMMLRDKVKGLAPLKVAVVHPADVLSLGGALEAQKAGILIPVLVGPKRKILAAAKELNADLKGIELIDTPHSHAAAAKAVELARDGKVEALMKGKLHTDELMEAVVAREAGLRGGRRMSHVFALDVPSYPKPLFLTDAAVNIKPTLMDKKDIIQNAVDLFHAIGLGTPKVAVLSAIETVNEKIPSTLDATSLAKMAERGQITGAIVDGPLAFDNAVSIEAAQIKGIKSEVAGMADILIAPDIESGNMLYKQLRYFSGAQGAGLVVGGKVPIILTSRAGDAESRVASCELALLYVRGKQALAKAQAEQDAAA